MNNRLYLDILVPLPLSHSTYTYFLEQEEVKEPLVGRLALIPFGKGKTLTGVILNVLGEKPPTDDIRYKRVIQLLPYPALPASSLRLWKWASGYYMCTMGELFVAAVPGNFRPDGEQKFSFTQGFVPLPPHEAFAEKHQRFTLKELKKAFPTDYSSILNQWLSNESIELASTATVYAPQLIRGWIPAKSFFTDEEMQEKVHEELIGSPACLKALKRIDPDHHLPMPLSSWSKALGVSISVVNKLRDCGVLERGVSRKEECGVLPNFQKHQSDYISSQIDFQGKEILLLQIERSHIRQRVPWELITTEVRKEKQVLLLFPTLEALQLVMHTLDTEIPLWHFHTAVTSRERHRSWLAAIEGKAGLFIGLRSAVWLPFSQLSLVVVVDEEDRGYRQYEPAPRFTASHVALVMANFAGAKAILSSATPSVESQMQVARGKYAHKKIEISPHKRPEIQLISMNQAYEKNKVRARMLSFEMIRAIEEALYEDGRALLFYQRKGYARRVTCSSCGESPRCPRCHSTYRFFSEHRQLVCPLCGHFESLPELCPSCHEPSLELTGTGVERLLQAVKKTFRGIEVAHLEENGNDTARILISSAFEPPLQVLQKATTIGVVQLDLLSTQLDFRANERTFRFLSQCENESPSLQRVVVQYFSEGQNSLKAFTQGDQQVMLKHELEERHLVNLPPFSRLIDIYFECAERKIAQEAATYIQAQLYSLLPTCTFMGPAPLPVRKQRQDDVGYKLTAIIPLDLSPHHVREQMQTTVTHLLNEYRGPQLHIYFDVDPQ